MSAWTNCTHRMLNWIKHFHADAAPVPTRFIWLTHVIVYWYFLFINLVLWGVATSVFVNEIGQQCKYIIPVHALIPYHIWHVMVSNRYSLFIIQKIRSCSPCQLQWRVLSLYSRPILWRHGRHGGHGCHMMMIWRMMSTWNLHRHRHTGRY